MNPSLTALVTKLNWQLNDLALHLKAAEDESLLLLNQIKNLEQLLHQPNGSSLIINPEFEINRLNFMMHQQEKKEELNVLLKNNQHLEATLKDKLQRIKIELKMLEKYMVREELSQKEQQLKNQQNALDEWVIQKREPA